MDKAYYHWHEIQPFKGAGGGTHTIHTDGWDTHIIHEIQEHREEILAIPLKTHATSTKILPRNCCIVWESAAGK